MTPGSIHEAPAPSGASWLPADGLAFDDVPRPGAAHMARDAADFARAEAGAEPFAPRLTWFTWDRPTVSLGRHEDPAGFDRRALAAEGIPWCVRPTGGRAVFHVDEWTYTALIPIAHPVLGGSLAASTRALTRLVAEALAVAYGLRCDPGPPSRAGETPGPPTCFARSYGYELTVGGRKLMGSAQRRGRRALLQQGSLLVGPGHEALGRYLADAPASDRLPESALAASTTNLTALLGGRPETAAFRDALAGEWAEALRRTPEAPAASGSGQSGTAPLDREGRSS